jgi:transposase-like protein
MAATVTINDVLDGHVGLDIECLDRIYLNGYVPSLQHRRSKYLNRAENSHQPTRQRERAMKRFRTPGAAQRFLAVFSVISPHFRPRRHRLTADDYRPK